MRGASEYCNQNVVTYIAGANGTGNKADELDFIDFKRKTQET